MLDNHPRHQLRFMLEKYGRSIIDDPRRCRGMLKDLAPKHQRETNLLMLAIDQKLVAELTQKTHTPILMHLDILAQRLHNNVGIQKEFAVWAIESWALALDVIQQPSAQTIITPEPKIIIPPKPAPIISSLQQKFEKFFTPQKLQKPIQIVSTTQQKIGKFIVEDGIATDTKTGLTWLRFAYGQQWENGTVVGDAKKLIWDDAMNISRVFNQHGYAGYNDWRVPTIDELKTLIDKAKGTKGNYIDADIFPKNDLRFWSCLPDANGGNYAWGINFSEGNSSSSHKNYFGGSVRLVR